MKWFNDLLRPRETAQVVFEEPVARIEGPPPTDIVIKEVNESAPVFKREYTARLDHRCVIQVTARNGYYRNERSYMGQLTQPNGNWVFFDPDRIADKILDPALVPLVEKACRDIRAMDREFAANQPGSFVDDKGVTWVRA